jgi:trimeric autotransporter adhesin
VIVLELRVAVGAATFRRQIQHHSGQSTTGTVTLSSPAPPGGFIVNLGAVSYQVSLPSKVIVQAGKTKRAFTIKALNVGAAQTFHVYAYAAGQGVRTTLTALP